MRWQLPEADTYFAPHLTDEGFQVDHLKAALTHCRNFRTAIDGGAHIGTWAAHMGRRFRLVLAFEPAEDTFECLARNLSGAVNVRPVRIALGERAGMARLADDVLRPGNTGARFLVAGDEVEVMAIDELDLADLDFLKLDIEGCELRALLGAERTLRACRPVVCIEEKKGFGVRFGLQDGAASAYLKGLGAREIERQRNDRIFVWDH